VLSGYLVTQVLLRDLGAPSGRIAFGRFYARRVRRLLPAAVLTIVVTAAVYGAVAPRDAVEAAASSMQAALLYVANWYFIAQSTDYFAPESPSPVLHFWSLAVEEQFYLVWPLALAGLWVLAGRRAADPRRRRRLVAGAAAVGAVGGFAATMVLRDSRAYFGTDTRAYQLLLGAVLALLPGLVTVIRSRRGSRWLAPIGLVAIVGTASSLVDQGPFVRGAVAALATAALILGVEAHQGSGVARALGRRPIAYLGSISYAVYLWHWPVIVLSQELGVRVSATSLAAITALVATGIAALSSELLELPIRRSERLDRRRGIVIVSGLAASVVAAVLVVPALLDIDRDRTQVAGNDLTPPAAVDQVQGTQTPVPPRPVLNEAWRQRFGDDHNCLGEPASACTLVEGDGPHILLIGDSVATSLTAAFSDVARRTSATLSLSTENGCAWQVGFLEFDEASATCDRLRPDTYDRVIPELQPDVVVVASSWWASGLGPEPTAPEQRALQATTNDSLDRLLASGADVVLVEAFPRYGATSPFLCLLDATYVEDCAFEPRVVDSWWTRELEARAAASPQFHFVRTAPIVCPRLPTCDAAIDGVPVFWDEAHLTVRFAESIGLDLARELAGVGYLPVPREQ
jgi:peptidoglycan/LPS O-acetylase OafA/YrhL